MPAILQVYELTTDDNRQIDDLVASNGGSFDESMWSNSLISDFKTRAKQHYYTQQNHFCCYCQKSLPISHGRVWDLEHIAPKNKHVRFIFEPFNLAASCPTCNQHKRHKEVLVDPTVTHYPTDGSGFFIVHPHFDEYDECISVSPDCTVYKGINTKGKFTITACGLNRYDSIGKTCSKQVIDLVHSLMDKDNPNFEADFALFKQIINDARN